MLLDVLEVLRSKQCDVPAQFVLVDSHSSGRFAAIHELKVPVPVEQLNLEVPSCARTLGTLDADNATDPLRALGPPKFDDITTLKSNGNIVDFDLHFVHLVSAFVRTGGVRVQNVALVSVPGQTFSLDDALEGPREVNNRDFGDSSRRLGVTVFDKIHTPGNAGRYRGRVGRERIAIDQEGIQVAFLARFQR